MVEGSGISDSINGAFDKSLAALTELTNIKPETVELYKEKLNRQAILSKSYELLVEHKAEIERVKKQLLLKKGIDPSKVEKVEKSPCPPDQVRNAKTKKCRERKTRKSPSTPKETPKKRVKLSPCPPGQKRDPKTKTCKARIEKLKPCPPGKKRDSKTKKCIELNKFMLHE